MFKKHFKQTHNPNGNRLSVHKNIDTFIVPENLFIFFQFSDIKLNINIFVISKIIVFVYYHIKWKSTQFTGKTFELLYF